VATSGMQRELQFDYLRLSSLWEGTVKLCTFNYLHGILHGCSIGFFFGFGFVFLYTRSVSGLVFTTVYRFFFYICVPETWHLVSPTKSS
jgi:hypothetical protein